MSALSAEGAEFLVVGAHAVTRRRQTTYGGIPIAVLSLDDLIANKKAVGRPQDLLDVEALLRVRDGRT